MFPQPYLDYLVQFHAERDYFECHEILEEYWKSAPPAERKAVWVGLIQIAVSLYHQRRGNHAGAVKMMASAIQLVKKHQQETQELGLDSEALFSLLEERLNAMKKGEAYSSMTLPISDEKLRQAYQQACALHKIPPHRESNMEDSFLLNKHTLRDRSDVLAERQRQLEMREQRQKLAD
jgi:predicted metal-dependent hydrolase